MGVILDHVPWWGQLRDMVPGTDGPDRYAAQDCGEECVCMVVWQQKRLYLREDQVRAAIPGHADHGSTLPAELAAVLARWGIAAQSSRAAGTQYRERIKEDLRAGRPVIILGWWQGHEELHWVTACGYGNDALLYQDPWDGVMHVLPWAVVDSLATGDMVRVTG